MAVGVQRFSPKPQQESDLDKIYKGVQALTGAVDLGSALVKTVREWNKPDIEKQTKELELEKKQREKVSDIEKQQRDKETLERSKKGVLEEDFVKDMLPKMDISDAPAPGYYKIDVVKRSGEVYPTYARAKKQEVDSLSAAIKQMTASSKQREERISKAKEEFDLLPVQAQEGIKKLSASNANKETINNQIKAAITQLDDPNISEDQKLTIGRSLLKTLNSTEGSDAVGSEEAARLGSYLEFKLGNFTGPGSFIGRDLDQFIEQTKLTAKRIDDAIKSNEGTINRLYGKKDIPKFDDDVLEFAKKKGISAEEALKIKNNILKSKGQ